MWEMKLPTRVKEMYQLTKGKSALLSSFSADFWTDYLANYAHYDKAFYTRYKNFFFFLQDAEDTAEEVQEEFTEAVYNLLLLNSKKYSELYRIYVINDANYSLTNNYDMREEYERTTSGTDTHEAGSHTDTSSQSIGATDTNVSTTIGATTNTSTSNVGAQSNSTAESVSPEDTNTFFNTNKSDYSLGARSDSVTANTGARSDTSQTTEAARSNSSSNVFGAHTDTDTASHSEEYTLTRVGNIGTMTATDMLEKHNTFWNAFEFYNLIFSDIARELLMVGGD